MFSTYSPTYPSTLPPIHLSTYLYTVVWALRVRRSGIYVRQLALEVLEVLGGMIKRSGSFPHSSLRDGAFRLMGLP